MRVSGIDLFQRSVFRTDKRSKEGDFNMKMIRIKCKAFFLQEVSNYFGMSNLK